MNDMPLTNEPSDTLQTLAGSDASDTTSEALMAHIDSVLSPKEPVSTAGERARQNETQAQRDELIEEGLQDEDGNAVEPTDGSGTGVTAEEVEEPEQVVDEGAAPLHPNLRYVAQYYGLSDDEIDEQHAANPTLAERVFGKMLTAFQAQTQSRPQGTPVQPGPQQPQTAPQPQPSELEKLFARQKEFGEANGDQLGQFLGHLKRELYDPFQNAKTQLAQMQAQYVIQQRNAIAAEATAVTNELAKQFPTVYGDSPEKANLFHQQTRQALYTTADQIRAGAYAQGKEISVANALRQAHLIVTADQRDRQVRDTVRTQVQRRSRQITARPTQRSRSVAGTDADAAAISAYEQRANELNIRIGD